MIRFFLFVLIFCVASCSHIQRARVALLGNPYSVSDTSRDRGRMVFGKHCAQCHGVRGDGDGSQSKQFADEMPDFVNGSYDKSLGLSAANIMYGKRNMPAYGSILSEREVWAVAHYVQSLRKQ